MAGRAPLPCGPPTGSSELPRHPVHSCGRHHPGVQPCAITRSGRSLGPEGWGQGQAQHTLQPEGLASLRAQSGTLSTQLQPAGRAPVCPRPTLRAPVNPPPSRPSTHSPSHCTRPPPLVRPAFPPHPVRPACTHSPFQGAPAELRGACYRGPGKPKALPSSQAMAEAEAEARLPGEPTLVPAGRTGRRQGPAGDSGTDPGLGGVRGGTRLAVGVFSPSKAHVRAALSVSPIHPHLSSPPSLLLSPALV